MAFTRFHDDPARISKQLQQQCYQQVCKKGENLMRQKPNKVIIVNAPDKMSR